MLYWCSIGPNKEDILQYVASELGDEWKKLAQYLSLKSVRIQAILRQNNQNPEPKKIRYDMLVTWAKRVPRCLNKVRNCKAESLKIIGVNAGILGIVWSCGTPTVHFQWFRLLTHMNHFFLSQMFNNNVIFDMNFSVLSKSLCTFV